jgi:hypothetical protein
MKALVRILGEYHEAALLAAISEDIRCRERKGIPRRSSSGCRESLDSHYFFNNFNNAPRFSNIVGAYDSSSLLRTVLFSNWHDSSFITLMKDIPLPLLARFVLHHPYEGHFSSPPRTICPSSPYEGHSSSPPRSICLSSPS